MNINNFCALLLSLLFLLLFSFPVQAQERECEEYRSYFHKSGHLNLPALTWGLASQGNYLFASATDSTFRVLEISNPNEPLLLNEIPLYGSGRTIALTGTTALVAAVEGDVQLIDISTPTSPLTIGTIPIPGSVYDLKLVGSILYVAAGNQGMYVFDVGNLDNPVEFGHYHSNNLSFQNLQIEGNLAILVDRYSGFTILDISNPAAPLFLSEIPVTEFAYDAALNGSWLYLSVHDNSTQEDLMIVDLTNPVSPVIDQVLDTSLSLRYIQIVDDYLVATGTFDGLKVLQLEDPTAPQVVGWQWSYGSGYPFVVTGNSLYTGGVAGVSVFDISNPASVSVHHWDAAEGYAWDMALNENLAAVALDESGLALVDVTDPTAMVELASLTLPGNATGVDWYGDYAIVSCDQAGVVVVDASIPDDPNIVGQVDTPGRAKGVFVSGDYAYVADLYWDLQVIALSGPAVPEIVGSLSIPLAYVYQVAVFGEIAYLSCFQGGLALVDVAIPSEPQLITHLEDVGEIRDVAVSGHLAVLADFIDGTVLLDVTDPEAPVTLFRPDMSGYAFSVGIDDGYAYTSHWNRGFEILDFNNPSEPQYIGGRGAYGLFRGFSKGSGWVFWAREGHGISAVPAQCPELASPVELQNLEQGRAPHSVVSVHDPYPNPFNPVVWFNYEVKSPSEIQIEVFDSAGRRVRGLRSEYHHPGAYEVAWNGCDNHGAKQAAGQYFFAVTTGNGKKLVRKIVMLK